MCFYIYAPKSRIEITFASESVTLKKGGRSEVVVDALIANLSKEPIRDIKIIYPNIFFDISLSGRPEVRKKAGTISDDITRTMLDPDASYNWAYRSPYTTRKVEHGSDELVSMVHCETSPENPMKQLIVMGAVGKGKDGIVLTDGLTVPQWQLLETLRYTIFKAIFDPPIAKESRRWVRWRFMGERSTISPNRKYGFWLRYTNQLVYDYQIFGPYDAKNKFMELLYLTNARMKEHGGSSEACEEVGNLIKSLEGEGLQIWHERNEETHEASDGSNVVVRDWRLHIAPRELKRITDIIVNGSIEMIGGRVPNIYTEKNRMFPVYGWRTRRKSDKEEFSSSVLFQAKETSKLSFVLPIILSGISLLAFGVLMLLRLFRP